MKGISVLPTPPVGGLPEQNMPATASLLLPPEESQLSRSVGLGDSKRLKLKPNTASQQSCPRVLFPQGATNGCLYHSGLANQQCGQEGCDMGSACLHILYMGETVWLLLQKTSL